MSQIDKLNFLPHLFWFFILFGIFYFLVFSYILPLIYQSLETRVIFFKSLLNDSFAFNIFFYFIVAVSNSFIFQNFFKIFVLFFKKFKNIKLIKTL